MLEQFARLNAKTASFKSSGNAPLLDVTDLCGVLASLPDQHSWYIYAMIEQRRAYNMELLHHYFKSLVLQEMRQRKFKSKKVESLDFAYGVTKAVLNAHFHPRGKCKSCQALGKISGVKCTVCNGTGRAAPAQTWSEKVKYGFPLRKDLDRKWYHQSCGHYDQLLTSTLAQIQIDLESALQKVKRHAIQYRREENESLFDDL